MLDFIVAIPARYASTRLPGKPLSLIGGKPMIVHVAERALRAGARQVVIATDDQRIANAVQMDSIQVCMTSKAHQSGTDRLAECAEQLAWADKQIVVNLQGDEPFAPAEGILQVARLLAESQAEMATLACKIVDNQHFTDPNVVKVVVSNLAKALYFSRAAIPLQRDLADQFSDLAMRHIGIYAYRAGFLKMFTSLPQSALEVCESLEQLRVLENGYSIAVATSLAEFPSGVDTQEDLLRADRFWRSQHTDDSAR